MCHIYSFLNSTTCSISDWLHLYHDVFQLHVQHVCSMDIFLPVVWVFICIHVVQDQLEEDHLLRDGTEGVVKAEHVVSILCFDPAGKTQSWHMCLCRDCLSDR